MSSDGRSLTINRSWAMPSRNTFSIPPIRTLVARHIDGIAVDPFVGNSPFKDWCLFTNDINTDIDATHHEDALHFLKLLDEGSVDVMLFDPPYSPRQVAEVYKNVGRAVNMQTTQASFWSGMKAEISRLVKPGGICITCGWNSGGIGKKYGFEIEEILLVAHGGWHNDTICVVDRKVVNMRELMGIQDDQ